jgi:phosphoribosylaminoimidazolecarboxamide formyltransferase/IMP cyclohydrolase
VIARALLSVFDKSGLDELATGLAALGVELVASGGTAAHLEELGLDVRSVEELTDVPELLGGRVKTLHPRIHGGILARRDHDDDIAALAEHDIPPFDLVCVNLYPFERAPEVELIDVGGPAMLRAAAKNWAHVAAVCRPHQYGTVLAELRARGEVTETTRRALAAEAFATTAAYDAAIASWLGNESNKLVLAKEGPLPERLVLGLRKELDLAYGENPHQRGAYYVERDREHLLAGVEQLHGRELSLINLYDLAAARLLLRELEGPACVIVKHANPCGAAEAATVEQAYERALAGDPLSAFGLVCAVNRPVSRTLGEALAERFVDVVHAPDYDEAALQTLRRKAGTRVLSGGGEPPLDFDLKRVPGGLLVQERDTGIVGRAEMKVACGEISDAEWADLLFASRVCKNVTSNAIVVAKDRQTIGIGGGQQSRVDAVRLALEKARDRGHDPTASVLASDAFFPFPDGPRLAIDAGVRVLVQPGGSKRDADVIAAVEQAGAAMVFTGRRHFRH